MSYEIAFLGQFYGLSRTRLKGLFGKDIPSQFFFDDPGIQILFDEEFPVQRFRFGRRVVYNRNWIKPRGRDGRPFASYDGMAIARGLCRSVALTLKEVLSSDIEFVRDGCGKVFDAICMEYVRATRTALMPLDYYPPQVLTPALTWAQGYIDWWEKYSGEKV
jgi:hypothetical protein